MVANLESEPSLHLLDGPYLSVDGIRSELPAGGSTLLLAYLGLNATAVPRERLLALFWPEATAAQAQQSLRVLVHRTKSLLRILKADGFLIADRQRLELNLTCDVALFRAALSRGDWVNALDLHRSMLMSRANSVKGYAAVQDWIQREGAVLAAGARHAALRQAQRLEDEGDHSGAAALLTAQLRTDVLAEDALQALLRVAAKAGERDSALHFFDIFKGRARDELGLEPQSSTVALFQALRDRGGIVIAPNDGGRTQSLPLALLNPQLVGREVELCQVRSASSDLIVVAGEPGIGKTHLLKTAFPEATWWSCHEGLQTVPLLPVFEWLKKNVQRIRPAVSDGATLRELARVLPELAEGELLPHDDYDNPKLLLALAQILPRLTDTLVVDDLQWVDAVTLRLLKLLAVRAPMKLLVCIRPFEVPQDVTIWLEGEGSKGGSTRVNLARLSRESIAQLLTQANSDKSPKLVEWLFVQSGGNPFFAMESLRALAHSGSPAAATAESVESSPVARTSASSIKSSLNVEGIKGAASHEVPAVPPRIAAMIQSRISRLPEAAQRALLAGAVAGDLAHLDSLSAVIGVTPWAMAEAVAQAEAAGLLTENEFTHGLVRTALLSYAPLSLLRAIHKGIALHCSSWLGPHRTALHWWQAGQEKNAITSTIEAARLDSSRGLLDEAESILRQALARCDPPASNLAMKLELAQIARYRSQFDIAEEMAQEVIDIAPGTEVAVSAMLIQVQVAIAKGQLDRQSTLLSVARAIAPESADVLEYMTQHALERGKFDEAVSIASQLIEALRKQPPSAALAEALSNLGAAHDQMGELQVGEKYHREALAFARRLGAKYIEQEVTTNLVWALIRDPKRHAEALALGENALKMGDFDSTPYLRSNVARLHMEAGRLQVAQALYERQLDCPALPLRCLAWARLIEIHSRRGDSVALSKAVQAGLETARTIEVYQQRAVLALAVLEYGSREDWTAAQSLLSREPLSPRLKEQLDAALLRRGLKRN